MELRQRAAADADDRHRQPVTPDDGEARAPLQNASRRPDEAGGRHCCQEVAHRRHDAAEPRTGRLASDTGTGDEAGRRTVGVAPPAEAIVEPGSTMPSI
ncbi:MAG TPA: hypothetical protein PK440_01025 [Candidatus Accumulibacter phosphatis]|nr:MAG: hypothetical protein AW07_01107 [Candidatus Accumulibacter sp. SK-11]HAY26292.1 hypothetical protein [Accumulibacter sp.]HCV13412.1 hypothetical protein [Accumulibacter sp.]HRL75040.1 hypothetical protein [Candidatus Accumulibacter phosphatis]HRQ93586.1 hypothetical protein [Candidatus Accumulibacter phosphatis]